MGKHQVETMWKDASFVKKKKKKERKKEKERPTYVLRATFDSTPDVERPPGMMVGTTKGSKPC